ncbi:MAG: peptidase T [Rikenellaceae bacterium]
MELKDRFLKYVAIPTQSCEDSDCYPSTESQWVLLRILAEEMRGMGLKGVVTDEYGYTFGTIPATKGCELSPVIGFIAHVDTSPDMKGDDIRPQIIECYDGEDITLNPTTQMSVEQFPELKSLVGHTIIHTDGRTLLGADDKAGVAEIMTAAQWLMDHPEVEHGEIKIGFTPDEEVGRGVDHFNLRNFGADYAYTVDGGVEGELEYENFNAAGVKVTISGSNVHPGYAKGKMINAIEVACELNALLPKVERPEYTSGYEGFYHLTEMSGTVEKAEMNYIIRDHSTEKFEERKVMLWSCVDMLERRYGEGVISFTIKEQYRNMKQMIDPHPELIDKAREAMEMAGVVPLIRPIRGGTDGARLSFMGLPCPNIFTGGMNFHGKYECCSLQTMQKSVDVIVNIAKLWAVKNH